ncbi:hypothetical protein B0H19DRAFT_1256521 [Mycena capillaripes]|nr:hypothetical protein B0H19DRAFT_1256521 [Mycena capillaripes]
MENTNIVEVKAHNFVRFSLYTTATKGDTSCHKFTFTFTQIPVDMRDVLFSEFSVTRVRVKVGSLKFSIRDTKHDLIYKTFKPLATRLIKK